MGQVAGSSRARPGCRGPGQVAGPGCRGPDRSGRGPRRTSNLTYRRGARGAGIDGAGQLIDGAGIESQGPRTMRRRLGEAGRGVIHWESQRLDQIGGARIAARVSSRARPGPKYPAMAAIPARLRKRFLLRGRCHRRKRKRPPGIPGGRSSETSR